MRSQLGTQNDGRSGVPNKVPILSKAPVTKPLGNIHVIIQTSV